MTQYVVLLGLKNDYNGVLRGPHLSRRDNKVTALRKTVRTLAKFEVLSDIVLEPSSFFGH